MKVTLLIKTAIKDSCNFLKSRRYKAGAVNCPICGFWASGFGLSPNGERENVRCPRCNSLERHRAQWLSGLSKTIRSEGADNRRILHFARDFCYTRLFLKKFKNYFTAEYSDDSCSDYVLDIQNTMLAERSFDIIICNHVLEHVEDDRKAIHEIYRLLKPDGIAFIQVPLDIELQKTIEDPSVTDPENRKRFFGQSDHLRMYGWDFSERLSACGFNVKTVRYWETLSPTEIDRFALHEKEPVFICKKNSDANDSR